MRSHASPQRKAAFHSHTVQTRDYVALVFRVLSRKLRPVIPLHRHGGEVETFAQHVINANTIDTLKFLNDESFELRDTFQSRMAMGVSARQYLRLIPRIISLALTAFQSLSRVLGRGIDEIA
jgi:hypothetical protein